MNSVVKQVELRGAGIIADFALPTVCFAEPALIDYWMIFGWFGEFGEGYIANPEPGKNNRSALRIGRVCNQYNFQDRKLLLDKVCPYCPTALVTISLSLPIRILFGSFFAIWYCRGSGRKDIR